MLTKVTLPKNLELQLDNFLTLQMNHCLTHHNDGKLKQAVKLNFRWIKKFAKLHYRSRITRAKELDAPEVKKAKQLAEKYIGDKNHDFFVTCVDGRNMPTVMFSRPPHVGGVLRAPAGIVNGFMQGQNKDAVVIDYQSFVVRQIISLLREKTGTIFYGLDSHLGCAARAQIHSTEGGWQIDGGVRADILSKRMIARGIIQLREKLKRDGEEVAEIIPIFFSYDPTNGGVISGLEMHVNNKEVAEKGYTAEVLDELAAKGKIVRTMDLLKNKEVLNLLNNFVRPTKANFRLNYPQSLLLNWQSITKLYDSGKGELFIHILKKLAPIYSNSNTSDRTLKQKAKFLLKNLVTRYSISGADPKWAYDSHQEEMIVITEGGYAPFPDLDAFAVFSRDLEGLLNNAKLTIDLIRSFRRTGKINDPIKGTLKTKDRFAAAPVLISNKSIFRNFQEKSWAALESLFLDNIFAFIKWDDPDVLNWNQADIEKFIFKAVARRNVTIEFSDALRFIDGLYELFNRMRLMMKDKHFRQMLLNGNIVVLNTLVDHNRLPRFIVQFVV